MQDVRIPFALDKASRSLVEVGDVERGRLCGCLCPSCKQGVIARHGEVNVWHFAHDQNTEYKPVKECDISFDSCCRQYAIELMLRGSISILRTPDLVVTEMDRTWPGSELTAHVTYSRKLDNLILERSSSCDINVKLGDFNLFLFLDYENRKQPNSPVDRKAGLLAIDISAVKTQFYRQKSTPGLLRKLLKELIEVDTKNKRWLYHPQEEKTRVKLRERIEQQRSHSAPQQIEPALHDDMAHTSLEVERKSERSGRLTCLVCSVSWHGKEFSDISCPKCNQHLFSRFETDT